eukprot:TRINITY_DN12950_c0_g1_i2.p1 TRINITY_DN12950_c0_g1~~TRINITY_DN12950_c0_g1_i2.p1  ORF type:complete len:103 (-),score=7.45 TRINITY_DN12950_c0_g1_i2:181-489(-)
MSPIDSNDFTRMRKGTWWLRRGVRFDAMRYWYQWHALLRCDGRNSSASIRTPGEGYGRITYVAKRPSNLVADSFGELCQAVLAHILKNLSWLLQYSGLSCGR